jgi:hypothetical protein
VEGSFERCREMSVSITDMEFCNSTASVNRFSVRTLLGYVRFYVWFNDIPFLQKLKKEDPIVCSAHASTLTYILAKEDTSRTIFSRFQDPRFQILKFWKQAHATHSMTSELPCRKIIWHDRILTRVIVFVTLVDKGQQ